MKRILILGAGMVGRAIAFDLSKRYEVTSADISDEALNKVSKMYHVQTIKFDIRNKEQLSNLIMQYDFIVSAVPGFLGYETLKTIIECKKDFVDISFLPEDALTLHEIAKQNNVCGIVDMGIAPGVPNLVAGYYYNRMNINLFEYMVGGLPKKRVYPFQYKAPFSPVDVLEEYTRPARHKINGEMVVLPAMSDAEYVTFDKVGTLEAFNTDGLRSLLYTLPNIPNMREKTLRYPGHIDLIKALQSSGFLSHQPITINNQTVVPFDVTARILFDNWKLNDTEPEFTIMKITLKNNEQSVVIDVYDEYDEQTQLSSMARTTGFTATAGVDLIINGYFRKSGIYPPELVAQQDTCYDYVIEHLKNRGIHINVSESLITGKL